MFLRMTIADRVFSANNGRMLAWYWCFGGAQMRLLADGKGLLAASVTFFE